MFSSVLIANRGEIACRIMRTARRIGLRSIAVYSQADARALHVRLADEAIAIGPPPAADSYLAIDKIIAAAKASRAQCIHPGYGFLAENAEFAQACADAGIVFIGPSPASIRAMGLKDRAKALMEKAGVPVVPGYHGERQEPQFLKQKAYEIGYPVLIKAVAGGGGKGMRRVDKHAEFDDALAGAMREASSSFGDGRVLIEKYVAAPRHIEVQVFADSHGNTIHLNERDCSLQRRHQKVIEEAPAPGISAGLRARMGEAAVAAARAVNYTGAGTVEFIAEGGSVLRTGGFWFMEMNTRLQVEHPVTEAITGLDLVEWQFRVAAGEKLPLEQAQVPLAGHAVEARLYAEDPARDFLPSTGKIAALEFPQADGIRVDTGVETGSEITPFYDPLIAKIIAHGPDRDTALERLAQALDRTLVAGPRNNAAFLARLCRAGQFRAGTFDTGFIAAHLAALIDPPGDIDYPAVALGAQKLLARERARTMGGEDPETPPSPWDSADGFQLGGTRRTVLRLSADDRPVEAQLYYRNGAPVVEAGGHTPAADAIAVDSGAEVLVIRGGHQSRIAWRDLAAAADAGTRDGVVRAPMHGKVLAVLVDDGEAVVRGQRVAIIEAMKMEHTLAAPIDGVVSGIAVTPDAQVAEGGLVMTIAAKGAGGEN
jgi:3-methylcrotonyl-CoA carboxylase alpha subunit